ncbi:hypothetical protein AMTRI_Chr03g47000 [Amborella trichopoda]
MALKIGGQVKRLNASELTYQEFVEKHLKLNEPVVITGLMHEWRSCKDWVWENGEPNLDFFSTHFGKSRVQVADCGQREFTDQKRIEMSVSEFISQWKGLSDESSCNINNVHDGTDGDLLYLKDWHFVKEYPEYVAYTTPLFFLDDWLNIYLDSYKMHGVPDENNDVQGINCSDYRFVYMGSKGTWTPLHADVFRSYSWSANVCGKKLWYLLSPSQSHLLLDRNMKYSVYDIFGDISEKQFPGFKKTIWLECTQSPNEVIFVPSGWYHQVKNLEDTISINHNWFNAYNLSWVWDLLVRDYIDTKQYIEDIRDISDDFEGLCQRNLAVNTGMNFLDFFIFIMRITHVNLTHMCSLAQKTRKLDRESLKRSKQTVFNLMSIRRVAANMESAELFDRKNREKNSLENEWFLDFRTVSRHPRFLKLSMSLCRTNEMVDRFLKSSSEDCADCESLDFSELGRGSGEPLDLDFLEGALAIHALEYNFLEREIEADTLDHGSLERETGADTLRCSFKERESNDDTLVRSILERVSEADSLGSEPNCNGGNGQGHNYSIMGPGDLVRVIDCCLQWVGIVAKDCNMSLLSQVDC